MTVRIAWSPSAHPDIASYDVEKSGSQLGPFVFTVNIPHNLAGANFDTALGVFFYLDAGGTLTDWYRLISIDSLNNRSLPSLPLRPVTPAPAFTNSVVIDHNYPTAANLRYQTGSGAPIEGALIRVYRKTDFDMGLTSTPLAITMTDVSGNWINPVTLTTGYTYTIQFAKEGLYGPDKVEVIL